MCIAPTRTSRTGKPRTGSNKDSTTYDFIHPNSNNTMLKKFLFLMAAAAIFSGGGMR